MQQYSPWYHGRPQIALYSGGVLGGFSDPLNATTLNFTHSGDAKPIISSAVDSLGQVLDPIAYLPKPTEIEIELTHADRTLWAAHLMGTGAAYSRSSATATSVTATLILNEWVQLYDTNGEPIRHISNVTITGKTLGTDFSVLETMGMVKALTVGTAGSQTIEVDLSALSGDVVTAGTSDSLSFSVQMEVANHTDGAGGFLWVPKVTVIPSEAAKLIGMDKSTLKFKGYVVKLDNKPLYKHYPSVVAAP